MRLTKIKEIIMRYDRLPLECDGMTKVLSYVFDQMQIDHTINVGILTGPKGGIPHFWIELENGEFVDIRCQMWQGKDSDTIPHGVFDPYDYPAVDYNIQRKESWEVPNMIYMILTGTTELLTE